MPKAYRDPTSTNDRDAWQVTWEACRVWGHTGAALKRLPSPLLCLYQHASSTERVCIWRARASKCPASHAAIRIGKGQMKRHGVEVWCGARGHHCHLAVLYVPHPQQLRHAPSCLQDKRHPTVGGKRSYPACWAIFACALTPPLTQLPVPGHVMREMTATADTTKKAMMA